MNQSIEMSRNKFSHVTTERHLNLVQSISSMTSHQSTICQRNSLKRSRAKISLQFEDSFILDDENGHSIISTAEDHLKSKLNLHQYFLNKPKLTSSTINLNKVATTMEDTRSMTFNVDFASTPKKIIQRSSTPKRIKTNRAEFRNTIIKQAKLLTKLLPPPQMTSSFQSQCKHSKLTSSNKRAKMTISRTPTSSMKAMKYPIKFLNLKTKDINRLDFNFGQNSNEYCCIHQEFNHIQPNVTNQSDNCYLYGDYKMWII